MLKTTRPLIACVAILASAGFLSGCTDADPTPAPTVSVDPSAVSSDYEIDEDGSIAPGEGVTIGTTVPTYFTDSTGTWKIELTIHGIEQGVEEDLSVITSSNTDLTGLVPYYTTVTATISTPDETAAGKSIGTLFSYVTDEAVLAPRLVSINGAFPACTGSDSFPATDGTTEQTITFCQVSLSTPADPVVQVNWQPSDTPYNADDGKPVFFRAIEESPAE